MRSSQLCVGGPRTCHDAKLLTCVDCGSTWEPEDTQDPGTCPECLSPSYVRERCDGCDVTRLERCMQSNAGFLLQRAAELDYAKKIIGSLGGFYEITCEEFKAMIILDQERDKFQDERQREAERQYRAASQGSSVQNRR